MTTTGYDSLGRVSLVTLPDGFTISTEYANDHPGDPNSAATITSTTTEAGKKRVHHYDGLSRLTGVLEAPGDQLYALPETRTGGMIATRSEFLI